MPNEEMTAVCAEWEAERRRHPFAVEGLDGAVIASCWEESASTYDGDGYATIRTEILSDLLRQGILGRDRTMIDIGCGPGLYERLFHPHLKSIHCIDGSRNMIQRLEDECTRSRIKNISFDVCRWEDLDTDERYDVVFSSLCPPLNNPGSILRMERYSRDVCVYISSASPASPVSKEVWRRLGKDYSFGGYNTDYPCRFLLSIGRRPTLKFYKEVCESEMPVAEAVRIQERDLCRYFEMTPGIGETIRSAVVSQSDNGIVREKRTMILGMLIWTVD